MVCEVERLENAQAAAVKRQQTTLHGAGPVFLEEQQKPAFPSLNSLPPPFGACSLFSSPSSSGVGSFFFAITSFGSSSLPLLFLLLLLHSLSLSSPIFPCLCFWCGCEATRTITPAHRRPSDSTRRYRVRMRCGPTQRLFRMEYGGTVME